MKSYHANLGAGIEGIVLRTHDRPVPGPHQILVQVRAASLNYRELSILRGYYPLPIKPDVILASDGAGEVVAVGENVTRAKVGDRIAARSSFIRGGRHVAMRGGDRLERAVWKRAAVAGANGTDPRLGRCLAVRAATGEIVRCARDCHNIERR